MEKTHQKPLVGAYLLLVKDNQVLLQKRKSGVLDGKYSLVAGHTECGENVIQAIKREAEEESNIILNENEIEVKVVVQRPNAFYKGVPTDIIDFFIYAQNYFGEIKNNEPNKCSELKFYPIDNLPEETLPHVKQAIQAYKEHRTFLIV